MTGRFLVTSLSSSTSYAPVWRSDVPCVQFSIGAYSFTGAPLPKSTLSLQWLGKWKLSVILIGA